MKTTRGLMSDKPFALSYPANLVERPGGDLTVGDDGGTFEVTMDIRPATPSLSAEFDARAFNGPNFIKAVSASVPGARLIGNGMTKLVAGPAYVIHWRAPANGSSPSYDYLDTSLYQDGRQYRFAFAVRTSEYERWRETIRFILANFSLTSEPRPCCAASVFVP